MVAGGGKHRIVVFEVAVTAGARTAAMQEQDAGLAGAPGARLLIMNGLPAAGLQVLPFRDRSIVCHREIRYCPGVALPQSLLE